MKRVLICTIARDVGKTICRWSDLATELAFRLHGQYACSLSVVENDSVDGTDNALNKLRREWQAPTSTPWEQTWLTTERLGTQSYPSVWSLDRLRNLANARQKCLDQVGDALQTFDKVCYVEPDVTYDPRWLTELILARHPLVAGLGEPDIYSGWSLRSERNPKESVYLYDTCATRATRDDTSWQVDEWCGQWRAKSVVPTDLGGADAMCLHRVWSTFNCFAVYNVRPFIEGVKWSCVNHRLDTGQGGVWENGSLGFLDADTSVMCETFRAHGYDKVFLNTNCLVRHA